jgi:hypothetical protein
MIIWPGTVLITGAVEATVVSGAKALVGVNGAVDGAAVGGTRVVLLAAPSPPREATRNPMIPPTMTVSATARTMMMVFLLSF